MGRKKVWVLQSHNPGELVFFSRNDAQPECYRSSEVSEQEHRISFLNEFILGSTVFAQVGKSDAPPRQPLKTFERTQVTPLGKR